MIGGEVKVMRALGEREIKKRHLTCAVSHLFPQPGVHPFYSCPLAHTSLFSLYHCPHPSLLSSFPLTAVACLLLQAASETRPRAFNH